MGRKRHSEYLPLSVWCFRLWCNASQLSISRQSGSNEETGDRRNVSKCFDEWKSVNVPSVPGFPIDAPAKSKSEPLLFKGQDFPRADVKVERN
jgi:hypothetical protein